MGQLTQALSTRSVLRLVPVALGTAAVLAGCGAGGHRPSHVAAVSAHEQPSVSHRAPSVGAVASVHKHRAITHGGARAAAPSVHKHRTISQAATTGKPAPRAHVTLRRSSAKHASRVAVSSARKPLAVSQAAVTGQTGPGQQVTIQPSSPTRSGASVQSATPRPGATIKTITGTHDAEIGTLAERTSVFLVWTASQAPIQIFTAQGNLLLSSHARNGSIRLTAGTYSGLRVASVGAWTLRVHATA